MKSLKTFSVFSAAVFVAFALCEPALAASGTAAVNSLFDKILSVLQGVSVVVVTCAIIWAGYKMLWDGASIRAVAGPVLGAVVIASAPWLAELMVG